MATRQKFIPAGALTPDASGKCWLEPYSILATNDNWRHLIMRFDEDGNNNAQITTKVVAYGQFLVPQDYVGSMAIIPVWTATVTTGNCVWDLDYRAVAGDDAESLDDTVQQASTVTDAAPTAANRMLKPTISPTAGNFVAGDLVEFAIGCDGVDASDTLAGARLLFGVIVQYADV